MAAAPGSPLPDVGRLLDEDAAYWAAHAAGVEPPGVAAAPPPPPDAGETKRRGREAGEKRAPAAKKARATAAAEEPPPQHEQQPEPQPAVNEYEAARAARIAANRRVMEAMGLAQAARALRGAAAAAEPLPLPAAAAVAAPRLKHRARPAPAEARQPARASRRLRGGEAPPPPADAPPPAAAAEPEPGADAAPRGRGRGRRAPPPPPPNTAYAAPFSLRSVGVTVWSLGAVHRGAWAQNFWSSPGCLYHHAYTPGYRATRAAFGRTYEMRVEAGQAAPEFVVQELGAFVVQELGAAGAGAGAGAAAPAGRAFRGATPTRPWTDVCVAHRTGQRVSGPLWFGFSDPVVQAALLGLYDERERAAALRGEVPPAAPTAEEAAAAAYVAEVPGCGAATAAALARTAALSGAARAGPAALRAWAAASDANAAALWEWLAGGAELPPATRRWPAWRARVAPQIFASLAGRPAPGRAPPKDEAGEPPAAGQENRPLSPE